MEEKKMQAHSQGWGSGLEGKAAKLSGSVRKDFTEKTNTRNGSMPSIW